MAEVDSRILARFWANVDKNGPNGCWLWTGSRILSGGYGSFYARRKPIRAHRYSWSLVNGPIPSGLFICHRCDVPLCVNPEHLFLGTPLDNIRDMDTKGRRGDSRVFGPRNASTKLTEWQARTIKHSREKCVLLALKFGVTPQLVSLIKRNEVWRHV